MLSLKNTVVSDWFFTYYSGTFGVHRQFYVENFKPLKEYLNDLVPFLVSNDRDKFRQALNAQSRLRKEMKTFAAIQKDLLTEIERKSNMEAGPSSSSENSQFDAPFRKRAVEISTADRHAKHVIHKMVNTIKALYNDDFSKTMQSYIIEMYLSKPQLRAENWQNILEMFNDYIASPERPKEASSELETDFKLTMTEMCDNEQEKIGLVDAEKAKKAIEEAREEARKEIEKAREEAEKKYAALAERYPDIEESQSESSPELEHRGKSSHSPKSSPKLESLSELSSSSKPPVIFSPLRDKRKREEKDSPRERKRSHKKNT